MSDDWFKGFNRFPMLEPAKTRPQVDPVQLQEMLQESFDKVGSRIGDVEAAVMAQIGLQKTILGALADLDLVHRPALIEALNELKDLQKSEFGQQVIEGMISHVSQPDPPNGNGRPDLKIVPNSDE